MVGSMLVKPVRLPPGRDKLAAKPLPTGSATPTNTIGISPVSCCSARTAGVVCATRTSGFSASSSLADRRCASASTPHRVCTVRSNFLSPPELPKFILECDDPGLCLRVALCKRHKHADTAHLEKAVAPVRGAATPLRPPKVRGLPAVLIRSPRRRGRGGWAGSSGRGPSLLWS